MIVKNLWFTYHQDHDLPLKSDHVRLHLRGSNEQQISRN